MVRRRTKGDDHIPSWLHHIRREAAPTTRHPHRAVQVGKLSSCWCSTSLRNPTPTALFPTAVARDSTRFLCLRSSRRIRHGRVRSRLAQQLGRFLPELAQLKVFGVLLFGPRDRFVEPGAGLVPVTFLLGLQGAAEVVVSRCVVGFEPDRLTIRGDRLLSPESLPKIGGQVTSRRRRLLRERALSPGSAF